MSDINNLPIFNSTYASVYTAVIYNADPKKEGIRIESTGTISPSSNRSRDLYFQKVAISEFHSGRSILFTQTF